MTHFMIHIQVVQTLFTSETLPFSLNITAATVPFLMLSSTAAVHVSHCSFLLLTQGSNEFDTNNSSCIRRPTAVTTPRSACNQYQRRHQQFGVLLPSLPRRSVHQPSNSQAILLLHVATAPNRQRHPSLVGNAETMPLALPTPPSSFFTAETSCSPSPQQRAVATVGSSWQMQQQLNGRGRTPQRWFCSSNRNPVSFNPSTPRRFLPVSIAYCAHLLLHAAATSFTATPPTVAIALPPPGPSSRNSKGKPVTSCSNQNSHVAAGR